VLFSIPLQVNISVTSGGIFGEKVKDYLRLEGTKIIQISLGAYIESLRTEYGKDLILPTTQKPATVTKSKTYINTKPSVSSTTASLNKMDIKSNEGCKLDLKTLSLNQSFKCRVDELFNVFTIPEVSFPITQ